MMYSVKELADLADVSRRTLHYYDELGLLVPAVVSDLGYRRYDEESLLRLQQIMFYREMGLALRQIRRLLDDPDFDLLAALQTHRKALQAKVRRLQRLMQTVDTTIAHLHGEIAMSEKNLFTGFSEAEQARYEEEAVANWGEMAAKSIKRWHQYGQTRQAEILAEGSAIYEEIAANMAAGPDSEIIQALLGRWHKHLRYFYEPTPEILAGLGNTYHDHPDFKATFTRIDPAMPAFLKEAIAIYVSALEPGIP